MVLARQDPYSSEAEIGGLESDTKHIYASEIKTSRPK